MLLEGHRPVILARVVARGRPASDPSCAGCSLMGAFRALRRLLVDVQGASGCDEDPPAPFQPTPGRWAALCGVADVSRQGASALLADVAAAGARILVVADRVPVERTLPVERLLADAGARVHVIDPADVAGAEVSAARALAEGPGSALVALAPCVRGAPRATPLAIDPLRCGRCGACLSLACPALSDVGGEAMVVEAARCTGCRLCAPLCRNRAIGG